MSTSLLAALLLAGLARATKDWAFVREPDFLFTFGDSSISVAIHLASENWDWSNAPASSPLDEHQIATWCNGPVWARQFADARRRTKLINFAVPGATVDNAVVHNDWGVNVLDMQGQLSTFFAHEHEVAWHGNNSLFAFQFGANDIWFSLNSTDVRVQTYAALTDRMLSALERLRASGARAFALTTALPFDRARLAADAGNSVQTRLAERITTFNAHMKSAMKEWCSAQDEVFCATVDTYSLASRIINNPTAYGFKEAIDFCWPYTGRFAGLQPDEYADPECVGPVGEYLWRDKIHPSYAFHTLWAQLFRDTLEQQLSRDELRIQRPARIRLRE
ncbi:hypothetical protein AURDEDRAFT_173316 [Auricularia subglabra TFB-10046 SS5]|uniref:Carbohydrate esterase family 16 protein n=1 Tax=Auricularia subglabra (strain TFB-10046 / SS5) TaxID=717982 RepID=J0WUN4_AURST|nr:hypothetical protein AURDEDRAFT_173316 [Auricularia subglabra TFB-10046 SS5]